MIGAKVKKKGKKSVLNTPRDWASMIVIITVQVAALTLVACFLRDSGWMAWTVLAIVSASALYFVAMFIYKIYRGRLCRAVFSKNGIKYNKFFTAMEISSEKIRIEPFSVGRKDDKAAYIRLFDGSSEDGDEEGVIVSLTFKRLCRLFEVIPTAIIEYVLKTTSNVMLEAMKRYAPQSLTEEIDKELAERQTKAESETPAAKTANKKKKKHKHK